MYLAVDIVNFTRKIVELVLMKKIVKTRLQFLAVNNFDFTRKLSFFFRKIAKTYQFGHQIHHGFHGVEEPILRTWPSMRKGLPWSIRASQRERKPSCRFPSWWGRSASSPTFRPAWISCRIRLRRSHQQPWYHEPTFRKHLWHHHLKIRRKFVKSQRFTTTLLFTTLISWEKYKMDQNWKIAFFTMFYLFA